MSSLRRWIETLFRTAPAPSAHLPSDVSSRVDFRGLEAALGHQIRSRELFLQAVIHRSYVQYMNPPAKHSNERLEFLGDSILNMVAAERLYAAYPDEEEGKLTVMRARLVNRRALVTYARQIRLRDFLLLSTSASQATEKGAETILADAYEAVIGAIYLDGGLEAARRFVVRQLDNAQSAGKLQALDDNYKSALLEYAQSKGIAPPRYVITKEEGPDHDRTFTVEVTFGEGLCGMGVGKNKKEAEQAAAEQALEHVAKNAGHGAGGDALPDHEEG
ncbi:MAG TPA: ribonuclease III [Bacteroidota bacterium]|nr:ribonuclease III [Bacteroidota bacterium]